MPDEKSTMARGTATSAQDETRQVAGDLAQSAKDGARDATDSVKKEASRRATAAKDGVADEVSSVASALRTAADELRSGSPQERAFGQIADSLADASDALREKDLGEMAGDLSAFARRNPLAFLGGAVLIGFAASRFGRATARADDSAGSGRDAGYSRSATPVQSAPAASGAGRTPPARPGRSVP